MERPKPHEASTRLSLGQVLATLVAHDLVRSPKPAERHLVPAGSRLRLALGPGLRSLTR